MSPLQPRRAGTSLTRKVLACCSILVTGLLAGGIFTFPLMSPVLAFRCRLTQPQLTTVVLAAMMGQYPLAVLAGKVIDRHGPSTCSLIAAVFFASAYGSFSYTVHTIAAFDHTVTPSVSTSLTLSFAFAGFATVFSYFSFLFAASRLFPQHPGIASGTSMALFGLSPLFLTTVASNWFTNPDTGLLHVVRFTAFLAAATGIAHTFGAISYNLARLNAKDTEKCPTPGSQPNERSQLLPPEESVEYIPELYVRTDSTLGLLKHGQAWLFILFCFCVFGASEMVISNIGTIVAALPTKASQRGALTTYDNTPLQVRLISIANTLTRILVGPLADFVSPVASYLPNGTIVHKRKHHISRVGFLFGSAILLAFTFFWTATFIETQEDLWILSFGTGLGYSATFTVIPSIISSIWGMKNAGRNFGILMYAPFVGNPTFSYFYAFVSESHVKGEGICRGKECWQTTFLFTTATSVVALAVACILWRQWKGRL